MEFIGWLVGLADKLGNRVYSDAGLTAFLLFCACLYLLLDNRSLRKEIKNLNIKMYDMGILQAKASIEASGAYDKISEVVTAMANRITVRKPRKENHEDN